MLNTLAHPRRKHIIPNLSSHGPAVRRSFATHLPESGHDTCTVQCLLGHEDVKVAMIYMYVAGSPGAKSPLDRLHAQ
ncbi:MAG: hypothetical protein BRD48_01915 [Bacteroidetes bacterium QS_9_68_14]|nr:MAG: hypothetical protein BRD48_01915 [Bacteroidetes bacterium QS_9_68_14]